MNMEVILADVLGYCMGVRRAMEKVISALNNRTCNNLLKSNVYSLGPLIHNQFVLDILTKKGLCVLNEDEIEKINILNASLKGMKLACEEVIKKAQLDGFITLVDGNKLIKNYTYPQKFIIKGDGKSASIAAASVLAKVTRDRYMTKLAEEFPQYGWAKNAGYLTAEHLKAIDTYGLSKYHRPSFLRKHFEKQKQLTLF